MALNPPRFPNPPPARRGGNDEALERAAFALQRGQAAEAEHIAADLLRADPYHSGALQIFGYALLAQDRAEEAIAPLERGARHTRNPLVETQLGMVLRQAGRHADAEHSLKRAVKRRPPFAPAFLELGFHLSSSGRTEEAIEIFRRGLEVAPNFAELSIQLGNIFSARNQLEEARDAYVRALRTAPANVDAMHGLARVLQNAGAYAQAVEIYLRLLAAKPDVAAARVGIGTCQLELGDVEAAFNNFRMATRGGPKLYGQALMALVSSGRGRFWIKPSAAARFFRGEKS